VAEFFANNGLNKVKLRMHGIPDKFIEHGKPNELHEIVGIDPEGIARIVAEHVKGKDKAVKLVSK